MVLILKQGTSLEDINAMVEEFNDMGFRVGVTNGIGCSILGLIGDTKSLDLGALELMDHVEKVLRVQEPYKLANRKFHPESTIVDVDGVKIGGGHFAVIAGPCSVESESQIISVARSVKASGAKMLRGGAYKPRTSPYSFQGLEVEGLDLLIKAKAETGLPIVSELMSPKLCEIFEEKVDVIQIGARNMQNFDLLKEVGKMSRPVVLKRGLSNSYEEWVMSAEYIMAGGNNNVILCERGIRTFENYTRNTLDISAIPAIKKMSHLPIIVDPSHAGGMSWMVESLALAAIAAGADGLMIEVHNDPQHALSDGQQSLNPKQFDDFMKKSFPLVQAFHPGM
ncbi:3-deoxy-7-phosphoheptulonate synthase [Youngiibacter multivorans]|uniref:3-deoxy-7-phosphoheptulonate synthase n=1 Tax=Youngiibacter multivorans TaxID=937251 RepID=A0ABS4G5Z0_9CLOT|nr:3-deoxy-7-phosphoheptulonate synthase [Youngiibacter multivorans]MBP1919944.1 3-deoxy-7-phosphoheptulonate synthase [Youngiibacter multivorans]